MKRNDRVYLQHIKQAIARIEEYTQGIEEATFQENYLIQDGVIRQLEIIGEAVKNLSASIRETYPQVSWQDIAGMRDKLIHQYFGVDIEAVWLTIKEDIPDLLSDIETILGELMQ